jgi:gas vesicle protein
MKRLLYIALFAFISTTSLSLTSCREKKDTGDKVEDTVDDAGDEIEDAADDVGDEIEDATDDN